MSIDGLMPPNLVNMVAMIRDFSGYAGFCEHTVAVSMNPPISAIEFSLPEIHPPNPRAPIHRHFEHGISGDRSVAKCRLH